MNEETQQNEIKRVIDSRFQVGAERLELLDMAAESDIVIVTASLR